MAATVGLAPKPSVRGSQSLESNDEFGDPEWQSWARDSMSSTSSSQFWDAESDVGSFKSASSSTASGGSPDSRLGRKTFLDSQLLEWKERFEDEHSKRLQAEQQSAELAAERDKLSKRVAALADDLTQRSVQDAKPQVKDESKDMAAVKSQTEDAACVARMVGSMISRIVTEVECEKKWSAEVQLLRRRLERSAVMQNMVQEIQAQDKAQQAEEWQRYLRISTVTACCGIALVCLSVASRRFRPSQ